MAQLVAYFTRHGETEANKDNCFRGPLDVPLNENGRNQALALRSFFANKPVGLKFSSPKIRAQETSNIIFGPNNPPTLVKNFDPLNVGAYAGKPKDAQAMKDMQYYQEHPDVKISGGERLRDFRSRVNPEIMMAVKAGEEARVPSESTVHSSTIHQIGHLFHGDHNAVKVKPGGVVGVYLTDNGSYFARPLLNPSGPYEDRHFGS